MRGTWLKRRNSAGLEIFTEYFSQRKKLFAEQNDKVENVITEASQLQAVRYPVGLVTL